MLLLAVCVCVCVILSARADQVDLHILSRRAQVARNEIASGVGTLHAQSRLTRSKLPIALASMLCALLAVYWIRCGQGTGARLNGCLNNRKYVGVALRTRAIGCFGVRAYSAFTGGVNHKQT